MKRFFPVLMTIALLTGCSSASDTDLVATLPDATLQQSTTIQSASTDKKTSFINDLASMLHNKWREARKKPDGTYEPRLKDTKDAVWIAKNGGKAQLDIANTAYPDLPADWQAENKDSAIVATNLLFPAIEKKKVLDARFVESCSNKIHIEWLKRPNNAWAKGSAVDVDYAKLPEVEKEKDRVVIRAAIQLAKELKLVK